MEPEKPPINSLRPARLEALSDGIFAIAMTLLVLELHIPVKELVHSENDLVIQLQILAPKFLSFFLSFLILGIFWVAHNSQYAFIKQIDRELLWINILFLLFISLIPFSTAILGEFIHHKVAVWVYWLNLFLIGFSLLFNWIYAKNHDFIPVLHEKPTIDNLVRRRILMAQVFYALGALAAFINSRNSARICLAFHFR